MAFIPEDLYTVSAGVELYNYWNPFVTKHDSSSFYNWEEDNLPLYDVEERTDFLWERLGFPASSIPGMALCVSSSSPTGDNNVFTSLSAAVDALPEVIRMPTLIEVAVSGDLGTLELKNIKCVGDGKLEIINRVFAPIARGQATVTAIGSTATRKAITDVSAGDMFDTISDTSALSVSQNVASLFGDGSIPYNGASFVIQSNESGGGDFRPDQLSVNFHAGDTQTFLDNSTSTVLVGDIASDPANSDIDDSASGLDYSKAGGGATLQRTEVGTFVVGANAVGMFTNNTLRSVKVYNCDGPIYIRGFAVQGATGLGPTPTYYEDYGMSIKNCNDIVIENCGVTRSKVGGLYVSNSDVTLNRRFFSGRNYDTNRASTTNYGVNAVNSTITLSSDSYSNGLDAVYVAYQHDYGVYLQNSRLVGGGNTVSTARASLKACYNAEAGIKLVNSVMDLDCDVDVYSNKIGLEGVDSEITLDGFICQYNDYKGVVADNCKIAYGKEAVNTATALTSTFGADGVAYNYRTAYHGNGVHLELNNSRYTPHLTETLDTSCPFTLFAHNIGIDALSVKPAINLNNSKASLVHSRISSVAEGGTHKPEFALSPTVPAYGAAISGRNNSEVELLGSYRLATVITGPSAVSRRDAGIFVDNNSSCRVSGPFFIGQYGVGMYAAGGSEINFCPHTEDSQYGFAVSSFDLSNQVGNHTSVEVHAYGPCMVVDEDSTINMRDLGDAFSMYPTANQSDDYPAGYHGDVSAYTHAGGMFFMPNPNTATVTGEVLHTNNSAKITYTSEPTANFAFQSNQTLGNGKYNRYLATVANLGADQEQVSKGGVCVQALGNSVVNVNNVSFNAVSAIGDGAYYDALNSPNLCNNLRIWSFGGGATLNCNHVSVSGTYPSLAGYHGPRAIYHNEDDPVGYVPSALYTSAFSDYPYGYKYNVSAISGIDFRVSNGPSGGADPLTGKIYTEKFSLTTSSENGTSPFFSGLSVLDQYGAGMNVYTTFTGLTGIGVSAGGTGQYLPETVRYYQARSGQTGFPDGLSYSTSISAIQSGSYFFGRDSYENTGPFRLYLEPDPFAHKLRYTNCSSLNDNRLYQVYSQGYHASGPMSATDFDLSTWDGTKGFLFGIGGTSKTLPTDGALYVGVEDIVRPDNYNIRLDESSAHAFANSKHCSNEFAGRPKMVDIYRGTLGDGGALNEDAGTDSGAGFKSPHTFDLRRNY